MKNATLEVLTRNLYWRVPGLASKVASRSRRTAVEPPSSVQGERALGALTRLLQGSGIELGHTLIVHSSDDALRQLGVAPQSVVDLFIDHVGEAGTVAMPAFPQLAGQPRGRDWILSTPPLPIMEYDVKRSPVMTGIMGWDLMRRPGAIRSSFPINSLAALGRHAVEMFSHEFDGELPTACGPNSAWSFCARRDAWIIMLGVDVAHTLTMNHVAEDCYESEWPVRDWYRARHARIRVDGSVHDVDIRERVPRWALYYAEGRLNADLREHGIVSDFEIGEVSVSVLRAKAHLQFLADRRASAYPYFHIPRRYRIGSS